MRPAGRACSWEQGEWAGRRAAQGAQSPSDVEAFGLIAAAPVKAGYSRQARRSRPKQTPAQPLRGRRQGLVGRDRWRQAPLWGAEQNRGYDPANKTCIRIVALFPDGVQSGAGSLTMRLNGPLADVAEWQTLQT